MTAVVKKMKMTRSRAEEQWKLPYFVWLVRQSVQVWWIILRCDLYFFKLSWIMCSLFSHKQLVDSTVICIRNVVCISIVVFLSTVECTSTVMCMYWYSVYDCYLFLLWLAFQDEISIHGRVFYSIIFYQKYNFFRLYSAFCGCCVWYAKNKNNSDGKHNRGCISYISSHSFSINSWLITSSLISMYTVVPHYNAVRLSWSHCFVDFFSGIFYFYTAHRVLRLDWLLTLSISSEPMSPDQIVFSLPILHKRQSGSDLCFLFFLWRFERWEFKQVRKVWKCSSLSENSGLGV